MTTEGWKEAAPLQRKLRFSVQVNIYLKPCICLKYENVNIENDSATGKTFLKFWNLAFQNEKLTEIELTSPLQNIPPPPHPTHHRATHSQIKKYFDLLQKHEIPKFQLPPPNPSESAHYVYCISQDKNFK